MDIREKKNAGALRKALALGNVVKFFAFLVSMAVFTVMKHKETFSENQNRYLASFPKFSARKVYNGSFTEGIEKYLCDHFINADLFVAQRTKTELMFRSDVNGVYILKDRLVEKIDEPDPEVTRKNIDSLNAFAEGCSKPVFLMLAPTQADIYEDELPKNAPNPDQKEYIAEVARSLHGVALIDVYTVLDANKNDYIYYRTDHHWTSKGAYLAFEAAARPMGYDAAPLRDYDIFFASDEFMGTFYSKTLYEKKPDSISIYSLPDGVSPEMYIYPAAGEEPQVHEGMYFYDYLDKKDKYSVFLGPNQPMITIKTGGTGSRLLVFKDSYAHSLIPFLADHYSEITMLDTRYIQIPYTEFADPEDYDQVLFIYNVSTFMDGIELR